MDRVNFGFRLCRVSGVSGFGYFGFRLFLLFWQDLLKFSVRVTMGLGFGLFGFRVNRVSGISGLVCFCYFGKIY